MGPGIFDNMELASSEVLSSPTLALDPSDLFPPSQYAPHGE